MQICSERCYRCPGLNFDPSQLPLPHGPEARFLTHVYERVEHTVVARVSLRDFQNTFMLSPVLDLSEWALEAMAQAAPLLLTTKATGGVIAKIDFLTIHQPVSSRLDDYYVLVELLGGGDSPLPHFRGKFAASPDFTNPLVEAEFKISLQLESPQS